MTLVFGHQSFFLFFKIKILGDLQKQIFVGSEWKSDYSAYQ